VRVRHHFSPTAHETMSGRDDWTDCRKTLHYEGNKSAIVLPDTAPVDCADCQWWARHRERIRELNAKK